MKKARNPTVVLKNYHRIDCYSNRARSHPNQCREQGGGPVGRRTRGQCRSRRRQAGPQTGGGWGFRGWWQWRGVRCRGSWQAGWTWTWKEAGETSPAPSTLPDLQGPAAGKTAKLAVEHTMKRCRALGVAGWGWRRGRFPVDCFKRWLNRPLEWEGGANIGFCVFFF